MGASLGFSQPGESLQRVARSWREFTDQHARTFGAEVEVSNGHPVGEFQALGFVPPWMPPMKFAKFRKIHDVKFRWDYSEMADELAGITAAYYQDAVKFAIENNKPEPDVGGPIDRSIRYVLGPPPLSPAIPLACEAGDPWILGVPGAPVNKMLKAILEQNFGANSKEAIDLIRAKMLAQQTESSVQSVPSLPAEPVTKDPVRTINDASAVDPKNITYTDFVKACAGRKMNIKDIADQWAEHKRNLASDLVPAA